MWTLGAGAPGLGMYSWRSCFCPGFPAERTRCGRREGTEAGPVSGYQPAGHTEDGLGCEGMSSCRVWGLSSQGIRGLQVSWGKVPEQVGGGYMGA